jgi:pyruvate/2-oxoglutarate dehydrogenase complex dihydrolipoamide acyltransferase (E2) component
MSSNLSINEYKEISHYTNYRKIAIGTWRDAYDPSTYCLVELDITQVKEYLKEVNRESSVPVKLSHALAQAFTLAIHLRPDINSIQRGKRIFRRRTIDLFHQIILFNRNESGLKYPDLSGASLKGTEDLSLVEMAKALSDLVSLTRRGETEAAKAQKNLISKIPLWLIGPFLTFSSFLIYRLNLKLKFLGITEDPFGSAIFSDLSAIKSPPAFIPLVPYSKVPLFISMSKPYKKPVVENDAIVIREVVPVTITFDHRITEGFQMADMHRTLERAFREPRKYLHRSAREVAAELQEEH